MKKIKQKLYIGTGVLCLLLLKTVLTKAQTIVQQNFPLNKVRLLNSPFLRAEKTDLEYILKLDPDRLLAPYLREAGLKPKKESYGNWENTGLDGHTAGHYLSALAQMYASTGNVKCKTRLDYMVGELYKCQQNSKNGYVGGVPNGPEMWAQVKQGDFSSFVKRWVPWYNLHKLFAGLRDAYLIGGNTQAKEVLVKLTDWADQELAGLTEQQIQTMLNTEHGGMNEVCADVAAITGDKKYLTLAKKFSHQAILTPLEAHQDKLDGLHANTQIPKVIGFERIAEIDHDHSYDAAAKFFWETVVNNRTISIGGNSVREHFNPSGNFLSMVESEQGPETCNSYNMLRLTKMLFSTEPDGKYMDYYERTLYNHILSSQHPDSGGFVYFTPIRPQHYRVYSQPQEGFWCCVGTGMENHGKYGEMIYSHTGDDLHVNLFIASALNWKEKGISVIQTNNFPFQEESNLQIKIKQPKTFKLSVRQPAWVKTGQFMLKVNGKPVTAVKNANSYVSITRKWNPNDKITIMLPMKDELQRLPDQSNWVSIIHGPIVLAAATDTANLAGLEADGSRFGHVASGPLYDMTKSPILIDNGENITQELTPVKGEPLTYHISNMVYQPEYKNIKLVPFFEVHDARYMLYWPIAKAVDINKREQELADEDQGVVALAKRTVDQVSPGEQQPESDHFIESTDSKTGLFNNMHWRSATGQFSYKMKFNPVVKSLRVAYYGQEKNTAFTIYINDKKLAHVDLDNSQGDKLIYKTYLISDEVKANITSTTVVKFVADNSSVTAAVTDVRLMR